MPSVKNKTVKFSISSFGSPLSCLSEVVLALLSVNKQVLVCLWKFWVVVLLLFIGISSVSSGGYKAASMKDKDFYPRQVEREQLQCDLRALLAGISPFLGGTVI